MRREKTHKICANHLVVEGMDLKPSVGSDKSWIYMTAADLSEGAPHHELFTVRFANSDHAKEFKDKFEEAKGFNKKAHESSKPADELSAKVSALKIGEAAKAESGANEPCCKKTECAKPEDCATKGDCAQKEDCCKGETAEKGAGKCSEAACNPEACTDCKCGC